MVLVSIVAKVYEMKIEGLPMRFYYGAMAISGGMWLSIPFLEGSDIPWLALAHSAVLLLALFGWFLVCSRRKHFEAIASPARIVVTAPPARGFAGKPSLWKKLIGRFRAS